MSYDEALSQIKAAAKERELGIKTYCLVYLGYELVPDAVRALMQATKKETV